MKKSLFSVFLLVVGLAQPIFGMDDFDLSKPKSDKETVESFLNRLFSDRLWVADYIERGGQKTVPEPSDYIALRFQGNDGVGELVDLLKSIEKSREEIGELIKEGSRDSIVESALKILSEGRRDRLTQTYMIKKPGRLKSFGKFIIRNKWKIIVSLTLTGIAVAAICFTPIGEVVGKRFIELKYGALALIRRSMCGAPVVCDKCDLCPSYVCPKLVCPEVVEVICPACDFPDCPEATELFCTTNVCPDLAGCPDALKKCSEDLGFLGGKLKEFSRGF